MVRSLTGAPAPRSSATTFLRSRPSIMITSFIISFSGAVVNITTNAIGKLPSRQAYPVYISCFGAVLNITTNTIGKLLNKRVYSLYTI